MHSPHLPFNAVVIAFSIGFIAETIPSLYFYQTMYKGGGTPDIGKSSCMVMIIVNIIALVAEVMLLLWAVVRLFTDESHKKSSIDLPF